jgi:hypothetical protein
MNPIIKTPIGAEVKALLRLPRTEIKPIEKDGRLIKQYQTVSSHTHLQNGEKVLINYKPHDFLLITDATGEKALFHIFDDTHSTVSIATETVLVGWEKKELLKILEGAIWCGYF